MQAQFYPMPAMAYIEDSATRITLATKQPLGVASLSSGQLEVCNLRRTLSIQIYYLFFFFFLDENSFQVMLDRRLNQDDNRGVGQGVLDNVIPTLNSFRLLVEPRIASCKVSFFFSRFSIPLLSRLILLSELRFLFHFNGIDPITLGKPWRPSTRWISFAFGSSLATRIAVPRAPISGRQPRRLSRKVARQL